MDIDNTIVSTYLRVMEVYNWVHGTNYKIGDVKSNWQLAEWFKKDTTVPDPLEAAINFYNSRIIMVPANPVTGAISILSRIHKEGLTPYFLSARPGSARALTFEWFSYWTPWLSRDYVLMQQSGNLINPDYKVDQINSKPIEVHFEDVSEDAAKIHENTDATIVMVNQPWNQGFFLNSDRFIRSADPRSMSSLAFAFLELGRRVQEQRI